MTRGTRVCTRPRRPRREAESTDRPAPCRGLARGFYRDRSKAHDPQSAGAASSRNRRDSAGLARGRQPRQPKVATRLLAKLEWRVEVAGDGVEALEILASQSFEFIFMDCQMPRMDGDQTTLAIRALDDPQIASMPIIAMTANAMKGDREKCREAGMDYFLSKPVTKAKLAAVLDLLRSKLGGETSDYRSP